MVTAKNKFDNSGALILLFVLLSFILHALLFWTLSRWKGLPFNLWRAERQEKAIEVEVVPLQKQVPREPEPRQVNDEAQVLKLPDNAPGKDKRPEKTTLYAQRSKVVDEQELPKPSQAIAPEAITDAPRADEDSATRMEEPAPAEPESAVSETKLQPYEDERVNDNDGKDAPAKESQNKITKKTATKSPSAHQLIPDKKKLIAISRAHDLDQGQNVVSSAVKSGKVVKLNTTEFDYTPYSITSAVKFGNEELKDDQYRLHILNRVRHELYYPPASAQNQEQGTVVVRFYILKDGSVNPDNVSLFRSSGYPMLDDALVTSIRLSSRFNPLPERLKSDSLPIEFTVEYILR